MQERVPSPSRWPAAWRPIALAAVAAFLALAFAGLSRTAEGAVALTATPNPVAIPFGQTEGRVQVSWNTERPGAAEIRLFLDGTLTYSWASPRPSGSTWMSVPYGHVTGIELSLQGARNPLASLQVTTVRPPVARGGSPAGGSARPSVGTAAPPPAPDADPMTASTAPLGCRLGCITDAQIERHGTYAVLRAVANQDVSFRVEVSTLPSLGGFFPGGVLSTASSNGRVRQFAPNLLDLTPDTLYDYTLTATDAAGSVERRTGRFLTLKRRIDVTFTRIDMIDDSDDLGSAEMVFMFCANDSVQRRDYRNVTIPQFTDGLRWSINFVVTLENAPPQLDLSVYGLDDDSGPFSTPVLSSHCTGNAVLSSFDEAVGTHSVLFHLATGPGEELDGTFLLEAHGRSLKFDVSGRWSVRYVP